MNISIKPTYLILASAFALASCSQNDMPGPDNTDGKQIVFRASLPEVKSRAQVITAENLPYFYVTAFDFDDPTLVADGVMKTFFANEKVVIAEGKSVFTSPYCCWPEQTKESHVVSFYGFYPGIDDMPGASLYNASTASGVNYKLNGVRVEPEIADQKDFVTAYTTGTMADNLFSGVTLSFAHQLSRIQIRAHGAHKSCNIEIAGVRIGGAGVEGTFDFKPVDGGGRWTGNVTPGVVEYIYRNGDTIFTCGKNHPVIDSCAVSIMGKRRHDGNENSAMLIPSKYIGWEPVKDGNNSKNQMYISVLLRVTDATPTAGINPTEKLRYPYKDLSHGADALDVPVVYLAVNKNTGVVDTRLYKKNGDYFTDRECTQAYNMPATVEVKEFGWAALPVTGDWKPGNIYTYTLDYTMGVGLHDPEVTTAAPAAGYPVISDRVGVTYDVKEWEIGGGSGFVVPGS